jgi:hypothetical protein
VFYKKKFLILKAILKKIKKEVWLSKLGLFKKKPTTIADKIFLAVYFSKLFKKVTNSLENNLTKNSKVFSVI